MAILQRRKLRPHPGRGWRGEWDPDFDAKAASSSATSGNSHLLFLELCCPPKNQKAQLFSDQNVFHNKPSGAFPLRAGAGLVPCSPSHC